MSSNVTTDAVVWIEICSPESMAAPLWSPLMQWCGLKSPTAQLLAVVALVTTDAVVWIEMFVILLAE